MTTTTRRQRTRKATTTAIVPRSPFGQQDTAAGLIWRAQVASTLPALHWDHDDVQAAFMNEVDERIRALRGELRDQELAARAAARKRQEVPAWMLEAAARGLASGELSPEGATHLIGQAGALPFQPPQKTIPVAQEAPTLSPLDPEMQRHLDNFEAAHKEDSAGPAEPDQGITVLAEPDPTAGPAEHEERQDDEALDKARVLRITSNPFPAPLELAPGPIPVGEWKKPGSDEGAAS